MFPLHTEALTKCSQLDDVLRADLISSFPTSLNHKLSVMRVVNEEIYWWEEQTTVQRWCFPSMNKSSSCARSWGAKKRTVLVWLHLPTLNKGALTIMLCPQKHLVLGKVKIQLHDTYKICSYESTLAQWKEWNKNKCKC